MRIALEVKGDSYTFAISDNGLGLTREDRDRAFDLNLRAAPLRDSGLGVGLTVVKLLVEQSGGKITSSAGEGQGSSFLLVLPRYELDDFLL